MAMAKKKEAVPGTKDWLYNGDSMGQKEFHRKYENMPEGFKAELLDGTVFVCEPMGHAHCSNDLLLGWAFMTYKMATPGVGAVHGASVVLGSKDEVQPDLSLRILPTYGGQSSHHNYLTSPIFGPPELVAEVAVTSSTTDLHLKLQRYQLGGVIEYVVVCLKAQEVRWFNLQAGEELKITKDGILRSFAFPGLWIHGKGLLKDNDEIVASTLSKGLASAEHSEFVTRLATQSATSS